MGSVVGPAFVFLLMTSWGCDDSPSTPTGPTPAPVLTNYLNTTIDGVRGPAREPLDLSGLFTVTMTAAPSCSQLPVPLRTRTYNARMSPTGNVLTGFTGALSGADFFPAFDTFWTGVGHDAARFHVFSWHAFTWWLEDRPIIERVGPNGFLSFQGIADAPLVPSPTAITARFDGDITFCSAVTPPALAQWLPTCGAPVTCRSDRHQFRMIRR